MGPGMGVFALVIVVLIVSMIVAFAVWGFKK